MRVILCNSTKEAEKNLVWIKKNAFVLSQVKKQPIVLAFLCLEKMSSSSEEFSEPAFMKSDGGLLPLSAGGVSAGPAYISTLPPRAPPPEEDEDGKAEEYERGLRQRRRNGSGNTMMVGSSSLRRRKDKSPRRKKRRSIRQVWRDWNAAFERGVNHIETYIELVIHYVFRVIEWLLLTTQRVGTVVLGKFSTRWGERFGARMHYFTHPISIEERVGASYGRNREYIWVLNELRRKCMMTSSRRFYLYKTVMVCLLLVALLCVGLFYVAESAEYNTHVRYMHVDTKTGREIMNVMYPPEFPRAGFNEDVEWMLYTLRREAARKETVSFQRLVSPMLHSDYVEIDTRRFGRVNVSISEMVNRMKSDSREAGNQMIQPCLCPAHYGIPLNIILIRYSLEHDAEIAGKHDVLYYEPHISTIVSDSIRGGVSMDTLVVPTETRLRLSDGLSPLEADFMMKAPLGISKGREDHRTLLVDLTDVFTGEYHDARKTATSRQKKALFERTRHMVTQDAIDGVKASAKEFRFKGELSIAYSRVGIRSLNGRGDKLPLAFIDSPYAYCVQRCLAAVDPYF
jgi:hypothetical protein